MASKSVCSDRGSVSGSSGEALVTLRLESARRPLLADALAVTEIFRRRMLGVAGRRFGADALPPRLFGRTPDGLPLVQQHRHAHFLGYAGDGREIDRLVVWCPGGLSAEEADVVRSTTLPKLLGELVRLEPDRAASIGSAASVRRWRSHTPFLPVRHQKRRGGALVPSLEAQIVEELERRGLDAPRSIEPLAGAWEAFRTTRRQRSGSVAALGAHGFILEFAHEVRGPLCLGRNAHFGMGLFVPHE